MSNPVATTVRGWLEQIYNRLAPNADTAGLLAEMRFLNRKLFGVDGAGGLEANPVLPALLRAVTVTVESEESDPIYVPLADYLFNRLGAQNINPLWFTLQSTQLHTANTAARLLYAPEQLTAAQMLYDLLQSSQNISANQATEETADAMRFDVQAILDAIGPISTVPGGFTARNLLSRISISSQAAADCCEEANGGGSGPNNPQPEFSTACTWPGTIYQPINLVDLGLIAGGDAPDQHKWTFDFNWSAEPFVGAKQVVNGVNVYQLIAPEDSFLEVCLVWNLTGEEGTVGVPGTDYSDSAEGAADIFWTPPPFTRPDIGENNYQLFIDVPPGTIRYIGLSGSTLAGEQMSRNVWFKFRLLTPS